MVWFVKGDKIVRTTETVLNLGGSFKKKAAAKRAATIAKLINVKIKNKKFVEELPPEDKIILHIFLDTPSDEYDEVDYYQEIEPGKTIDDFDQEIRAFQRFIDGIDSFMSTFPVVAEIVEATTEGLNSIIWTRIGGNIFGTYDLFTRRRLT